MLETYGRYQLLKKLATGGMAQIYLARQSGPEGFEKLLVVKRILPHLAENEDFITMFLDEARIAARLNHPNIVQIFDLGAQDDSFFIAMEYIHGEDVRRVWKHAERLGEALPIALICRVIIEACAGLDYAHKKTDPSGRPLGIVHRDISPQNILVSFEGGVKVVDFGIAKAADQATVTRSGVLKGKYSYMSPEQASGQPIDHRTDIFALGVVMYELLTGSRLFKRPSDIQTLNAVIECKVPRPSEVSRRVPADLETLVLKALARDRNHRFTDARQLGNALEDWLLSNKLPSSSTALAEFMQRLYAERLAREQEEGRLLVETVEASRGEEPLATPTLDSVKRAGRPQRATGSSASRRELEPTAAERPAGRSSQSLSRKLVERPSETRVREPTEASLPTQSNRPPRWPWIAATLFALAVLGGALAFVATRPGPGAGFSLDSTPSGATVSAAGKTLCTTPCVVDGLPAGDLSLTVSLEGRPAQVRATALRDGVHELLLPVTFEAPAPPAIDAGTDLAPVAVRVQLSSDPEGARVLLDGQPAGTTPLVADLPRGGTVRVQLELPGYLPVDEPLAIGTDDTQTHDWPLKPRGARPTPRPPPVVPVPDKTQPLAHGTVRFVIKPATSYADVDCPRLNFKAQTPFPDQAFPVGEYSCTFSNPDFPPQTQTVRVVANEVSRVQVTFRP